jgi:hypothetical protein
MVRSLAGSATTGNFSSSQRCESEHEALPRLAALAPAHTNTCMTALEAWTRTSPHPWVLQQPEESIRAILKTVIASGDAAAQKQPPPSAASASQQASTFATPCQMISNTGSLHAGLPGILTFAAPLRDPRKSAMTTWLYPRLVPGQPSGHVPVGGVTVTVVAVAGQQHAGRGELPVREAAGGEERLESLVSELPVVP